MNINTNTGNLTLTKTEQKLLANAKALLVKLAKHADGDMANAADDAATAIAEVEGELNKVEEQKAA